MKKSLIIFLSLIFMSMSAFAVGVDCWEEYSEEFTPNTKSKMATSLGDNIEIIMVKADIRFATLWYSSDYVDQLFNVDYPISGVAPLEDTYNSKTYYPKFQTAEFDYSSSNLKSPRARSYTLDGTSGANIEYMGSNDSDYRMHRFALYSNSHTYGIFKTYKFTYCIVSDHSSSGGGGGAAGASVNYIIKAN